MSVIIAATVQSIFVWITCQQSVLVLVFKRFGCHAHNLHVFIHSCFTHQHFQPQRANVYSKKRF